jgi:hypothetical protein
MNIKDVKTAIKIGDFVLKQNHENKIDIKYQSTLSTEILTDGSARVYLIVQNGIIKKIGGSTQKGGIILFPFLDNITAPFKDGYWKNPIRKEESFKIEELIHINSKDFNKFKKIFFQIDNVLGNNYFYYTKLKNALDFYKIRLNDEEANLERLMYSFIILESLFSDNDDKDNISFKIRIRTSYFISRDKEKRKKIFENLKDLYSLRSDLLHGGAVYDRVQKKASKRETSSYAYWESTLNELDLIIRKVFNKILTDKNLTEIFNAKTDGEQKKLSKFLNDIVL